MRFAALLRLCFTMVLASLALSVQAGYWSYSPAYAYNGNGHFTSGNTSQGGAWNATGGNMSFSTNSVSQSFHMDSQGTVTATFTWTRTGGITDNPPATVWIKETPSAKYSGGGMGATSTGSASNGIVPSVDVTGGKDSTCSRLVKVTVSSDTAVITSPQMAATCDFTPASGGTGAGQFNRRLCRRDLDHRGRDSA